MKNLITGLEIKSLLLFPILFLLSCHSSNEKTAGNNRHIDTVIIKQMQFNPAVITVNKGDTVIWINNDMVDHNVTEEKSKAFYSDTIHVGNSWMLPVTESVDYYCTIHPSMKGKIIVK